jgi:hypothetical protein
MHVKAGSFRNNPRGRVLEESYISKDWGYQSALGGWFWLNQGSWHGTKLLRWELFRMYCKLQISKWLPFSKGNDIDDYPGIGHMG